MDLNQTPMAWRISPIASPQSRALGYGFVLLLCMIAALGPARAAEPQTVERTAGEGITQQSPFPMSRWSPPEFPPLVVDIRDHGAVGDGQTDNTAAIRRAIADCVARGGGRVLIPPGAWLTGPIHLKSHIDLHIDQGAVLKFSTNPEDYLPPVFVRWAGLECYNYSPLIYAHDCENLAITGQGSLDGQGSSWWHWVRDQDRAARHLYDMVLREVPVKQRVFGNRQYPMRPQFIHPIGCKNVLIEGISIGSGPFWTIQATYCENVIVRNVTIDNVGPNNDGVNADSCRNVLIEGCTFSTGDDAVAIKSGLNEDGWRVGRPCENIVVRHCTIKTAHGGISIGSEMSGDVRNVWVHDCHFDGTLRGLWIKSTRSRGGIVEHVYFEDCTMRHLHDVAIGVITNYRAWFGSDTGKAPNIRDIHVRNVRCMGAKRAILIEGLPERPIVDVELKNITIVSAHGLQCSEAERITMTRVDLLPYADDTVMRLNNAREVILRGCSSPAGADTFVAIEGKKSKAIRLVGNRTDSAKQDVRLGTDVDPAEIIRQ